MTNNYLKVIFRFANKCRAQMLSAVLFSVLSVVGGIVPFYAVAHIITGFFVQEADKQMVLFWCGIGFQAIS